MRKALLYKRIKAKTKGCLKIKQQNANNVYGICKLKF